MTALAKYIPAPRKTELFVKEDFDTLDIMARVFLAYSRNKDQLKDFARFMKGETVKETCRNIWQWVKTNIRYQKDRKGDQWVKSPAALNWIGAGDCKSYSVFIASCLYSLGIKGCFRFVSFDPADATPTHVYIVVRNRGEDIIIDDVMPGFNQEKQYTSKMDFNMGKVGIMEGIDSPRKIEGGLATTLNKTGRRQVFNSNIAGLAILALYQFIPAGPKVEPGFESLAPVMGSQDDLLRLCPAVVRQKRTLSLLSFWDIGDWADWKVETDVFPKLKNQLGMILGMDPQDWWRAQLQSTQAIGFVDPELVAAGADQAANAFQNIMGVLQKVGGAIGKFFGGTDLKWKRGDPSTWGPSPADWNSYPGRNPLLGLNLSYDDASGVISKNTNTFYPAGGGGYGNPTTTYPAQQSQVTTGTKDNTTLYLGIAAVGAFLLLK